MTVPSEPWGRVHDRKQKKFNTQVLNFIHPLDLQFVKTTGLNHLNLQLLAGATLFAVTAMAAINTVVTNSTPYHLLKLDVKFEQAE